MKVSLKAVGVAVVLGIGCICAAAEGAESSGDGKLKALIVDGQNNHDWRSTTPVLKRLLEDTGLFVVDVATTPQNGQPMDTFRPDFSKYSVVVSNYNDDEDVDAHWPKETQDALVEYMENGGGLVVVHAADNAFPNWKEWNEMIGLGGWGGRDERAGPMVRYRDGKVVFDNRPGPGGDHGPDHAFQVIVREREHPIVAGLPEKWMHARDELYSELRGPAKNLTVLATAYADPEKRGTGEHEPVLFTISYGKGRIFHTVLGHDERCMECVGFIATFQRGTEWAASGKVTQKVPADFPTATKVSRREDSKSVKTHLGGCILISPMDEVPSDLYQESDIIQTDEYKPFTKKLSVCGITLIGRDDISDDFMRKVAKTIKEMFPQGGSIDAALQAEVLKNLYRYRAVIPFFKGEDHEFAPSEEADWDITCSQNSICDVIFEDKPGPGQVNEVVEHILHFVSDVGLHYTFPGEWGISKTSKLYQAMQEAIDKKYYDIRQYDEDDDDDEEEDEEKNRVLLQEYGYWIIYTAWDLREPYGPKEAEWTIMNSAELKAKLPQSYQLVEQIIPKVMAPPRQAMLEEFTRNGSTKRSRSMFTKQVEVFGLHVYATNTTGDDKLLHAANVLAEYIDNDQDGIPDNPKIMKALIEGKGAIVMRKTERERTTGPRPRGQGLYDEETIPNARAQGRFDASLEEILHMVSDVGWGGAYPEVFGRVPGTEISNALDKARGGRFMEVPERYPNDAWFTYYDETCDYDCMNSEYIYWVLTSILGAQDYPGRYEQIKDEWRLNTREKVKEGDPVAYALFTDPKYKFPTVLPDGKYKAKTFTIQAFGSKKSTISKGRATTGSGSDITSNLVAYYDFENVPTTVGATVVDRTGNGHDGTCKKDKTTRKAPTIVAGPAGLGKCLYFDGKFFVEIPDHSDFDMEYNVTVACWAYVEAFSKEEGYDAFVTHGDYSWRLQRGPNLPNGLGDIASFSLSGVHVYPPGGGGETWGVDGVTNIHQPARWVHLVSTYSTDGPDSCKLYVDGVLDASGDVMGPIENAPDPVMIGAWQEWNVFTPRRMWPGMIDEVRVYNRALSAADVRELYRWRSIREGDGKLHVPRHSAKAPDPAEKAQRVEKAGPLKLKPLGGDSPRSLRRVFSKHVEVFGIKVYASRSTPDAKVLHAASVLAEYLDNDEDGRPDNPLVVEAMKKHRAGIMMFATEREDRRLGPDFGDLNLQGLFAEETWPGGAARGRFDATLEEVLHVITQFGYAEAYPEVFGERAGTAITKAMDRARGGHFQRVPRRYPPGAWYTYDDRTCDYACQVTEYTYWALTSILGGQDFPGRLGRIQEEWRLNTREKVKAGDPGVYQIMTDRQYKLPTVLPDGTYRRKPRKN